MTMRLARSLFILALCLSLRAQAAELKLSLDGDVNARNFPAISANGKEVAVVFGNRTAVADPPVVLQILDVHTGQQIQQFEVLTTRTDRASGAMRTKLEKAQSALRLGHFKTMTLVPRTDKSHLWVSGDVTFEYRPPTELRLHSTVRISRGTTAVTDAELLHVAVSPHCAGDDTNLTGVSWVNPWLENVWCSPKDEVAVFEALTNTTARDGCEGEEHYSAIKLPP